MSSYSSHWYFSSAFVFGGKNGMQRLVLLLPWLWWLSARHKDRPLSLSSSHLDTLYVKGIYPRY